MIHHLLTIIDLIWPIILGIIVIIIIFTTKDVGKEGVTITLPLFGFHIDLPIKKVIYIRSILVLVALGLFSVPSFKDYSTLFPNNYEIKVFYDDEGISDSLNVFNKKEISNVKIMEDWQKHKNKYFQNINYELKKLYGVVSFYEPNTQLYSEGQTKIIVVPIKGWQRYYIKEANGFLSHHSQTKNGDTLLFNSKFELLNTKNTFIRVSLYDIYLGYCKVITPDFVQIATINVSGNKYVYHHNLKALTKITFFPLLDISNTVYLKTDDGINYFPIGYAVYKPM